MASVKLQNILVLFYFLGIHFAWYSVVGKSPSIPTRGTRRWEPLSYNRTKKQTNECSSEQWTCEDRGCISIDGSCDGLRECDDGSDETEKACGGSACPGFLYRCAYGACVDGDAPCNGVMDCADGSDEDLSLCKQSNLLSTTTDSTIETTETPFPFRLPAIASFPTPPSPLLIPLLPSTTTRRPSPQRTMPSPTTRPTLPPPPPPPPFTTRPPPPTTNRPTLPPPPQYTRPPPPQYTQPPPPQYTRPPPPPPTRPPPPPPYTYRPPPSAPIRPPPLTPLRQPLPPTKTNRITGFDSPQPAIPRLESIAPMVGSGSYSSQEGSNAYIGIPSSYDYEPPSQIIASQGLAGAQSLSGFTGQAGAAYGSISGVSGSSSDQGQTIGSQFGTGYSPPVAAFGQSSGAGQLANDYNTYGGQPVPITWDSNRDVCLLPSYPINGYYVAVSGGFPGDIETYVDITYSCDDGYNLVGGSRNTCYEGIWNFEHPVCERMCKPLRTRHAECFGLKNRCDLPQKSKTVAFVTCRNEFHFPVLRMALHCNNGKWDNQIPECAREDARNVQVTDNMLMTDGVRTSNEDGGNYIITIMEGPFTLRIEASHGNNKNITENINLKKQ